MDDGGDLSARRARQSVADALRQQQQQQQERILLDADDERRGAGSSSMVRRSVSSQTSASSNLSLLHALSEPRSRSAAAALDVIRMPSAARLRGGALRSAAGGDVSASGAASHWPLTVTPLAGRFPVDEAERRQVLRDAAQQLSARAKEQRRAYQRPSGAVRASPFEDAASEAQRIAAAVNNESRRRDAAARRNLDEYKQQRLQEQRPRVGNAAALVPPAAVSVGGVRIATAPTDPARRSLAFSPQPQHRGGGGGNASASAANVNETFVYEVNNQLLSMRSGPAVTLPSPSYLRGVAPSSHPHPMQQRYFPHHRFGMPSTASAGASRSTSPSAAAAAAAARF